MQEQLQPNRLKQIRLRLGLTQQEFADMLGVSQGNVGHYELRDQVMPPHVARDLIEQAAKRGHRVTYEDIYGTVDEPVVIAKLAITPAARESNQHLRQQLTIKVTSSFRLRYKESKILAKRRHAPPSQPTLKLLEASWVFPSHPEIRNPVGIAPHAGCDKSPPFFIHLALLPGFADIASKRTRRKRDVGFHSQNITQETCESLATATT